VDGWSLEGSEREDGSVEGRQTNRGQEDEGLGAKNNTLSNEENILLATTRICYPHG
jgi:hypothetical protein